MRNKLASLLIFTLLFTLSSPPGLHAQTRYRSNYDDFGNGNAPSHETEDTKKKKKDSSKGWIAPAIIGGVAALAALSHLLSKESKQSPESESPEPIDKPVEQLLEQGPLFPHQFNMSAFGIRCLVKGGWPIVIDYEQKTPGYVNLQISARGTEIITYPLHQFIGVGRHQLKFALPAEFGDSLKPALVAVMATKDPEASETLSDFRVFAIGIGPRAVGSVAIDEILFNPDDIRPQYREKAKYMFHSKSDFDNASVEIMNVDQGDDGKHIRYVDRELIPEGVRQGQWVGLQDPREWDGKDNQEQISEGNHQLQVRTWDLGGDWVGAWSDSLVKVHK